ncbi:hypothetical protein ETAA8_30630 [Anatilimnocola aggregata]|uniref:Uncharacterized protein n=1 Tax=Anatilimnocola aggregata TaxID=2528021 RepID=A0A517YCM2_9BACT|nr:hypothetical protein [Anatilimnocola aggregata]QDU27971.1 hypothetical protein ETAA8_30630 [Anatilimnocola aggregata]
MLKRARLTYSLVATLVAWQISTAYAQVGDPTLRTDHPQYAGEGAFQTVADCVKFAVNGKQPLTEQEQAIAVYNWLLTHQWHLASPQEFCSPGRQPDTNAGHEDSIVYDAARARFSYGYGLCGTVHAWNEPYWQAAGFAARRRAFPGHTNSEIQYGGTWHAFDTDMAGLLFRQDGIVAGYEDIIADPTLAGSVKAPVPHYPFAWPGDFNGMKKGWLQVAKEPNKWYRMYNGGYECQPGIVNLRAGETFTRWFDPDHFGGPTKRRFWHHQPGGPFRDWTFANNGQPRHDGREHNARGNASYSNGEFVYQPDLAKAQFAKLGDKFSVTFTHWSPYVICGDPVDDANPMTGRATDGLIVSGKLHGEVQVDVSPDQGQTWTTIENPQLPLDLTERVKGRNGWHVRLLAAEPSSINEIKFTTTTQVCQAIYPRLRPGGSQVDYRAAARGVVAVLPNFGLAEEEVGKFEDVSRRSSNLAYRGRSAQSRLAYETTNNKPASTVFPIVSQHPLVEVRAAIRYQVRVPPPQGHDYCLEVSTDAGKTWQTFAKADIPKDNEFSSGWLAGAVNIADAKKNQALVRVTLYAGGHKTGLIDAQFYGIYEQPSSSTMKVEYGWLEAGKLKTHTESIPVGTQPHTWKIPTDDKIVDDFVRLSASRE